MGNVKQSNQNSKRLIFTQSEFSGGINTMDLDQVIGDNCVKLAKNFDLSLENNLDKRKGYQSIYNQEYKRNFERANPKLGKIIGNIQGMVQAYHSYTVSKNNTYEFWAIGGRLYKYPFIFSETPDLDEAPISRTYQYNESITFQPNYKFDIIQTVDRIVFLTGTYFYEVKIINGTDISAIQKMEPYVPTFGEFNDIRYGNNNLSSRNGVFNRDQIPPGTIAGIFPTNNVAVGDKAIFWGASTKPSDISVNQTCFVRKLSGVGNGNTVDSSVAQIRNMGTSENPDLEGGFAIVDTTPISVTYIECAAYESYSLSTIISTNLSLSSAMEGTEWKEFSQNIKDNLDKGINKISVKITRRYVDHVAPDSSASLFLQIFAAFSDAPHVFVPIPVRTSANPNSGYNKYNRSNFAAGFVANFQLVPGTGSAQGFDYQLDETITMDTTYLMSTLIVDVKVVYGSIEGLDIAAKYGSTSQGSTTWMYALGNSSGDSYYKNIYQTTITPKIDSIKISPNFRYLEECRRGFYKNGYLMVYGGDPNNNLNKKNTVFISALNKPHYFPEYTTIDITNGDEITSIVEWNSEIQNVIFTRNAIYKMTFSDPTDASIHLITSDMGCTVPYSPVNVNNKLYFASKDCIYSLENVTWSSSGLVNTKIINQKITKLMIGEGVNISEDSIAWGVRNEYHINIPGIEEYNDDAVLTKYNRIFKLYTLISTNNNACWYMDEGKYLNFASVHKFGEDVKFICSDQANILHVDDDVYVDGDVDQFWNVVSNGGKFEDIPDQRFEVYETELITKAYNTSQYPLHKKNFRRVFVDVGLQKLQVNLLVGSQVDGYTKLNPTQWATINSGGGLEIKEVNTPNHIANPGTFTADDINKGSFIWKTSRWGWKRENLKFHSSFKKGLAIAIVIKQVPGETSPFKIVNVGMEYRVRKIGNSS